MFKSLTAFFVAIFVFTSAPALAGPDFPRLGGYLIGSPQNYDDPSYQAAISKLDVAVIGTWPGWRKSAGSSALDQAVRSIKNQNPTIKVFHYEILEAIGVGQAAYSEVLNKINSMNWWAYVSGTSGQRVLSSWQGSDGPFYEINITDSAPSDSNGDKWTDWYAKWAVRTYITPTPSLDGLYTDNVTSGPPLGTTDADWNRDGTAESSKSQSVQQVYRQGYLRFFGDLRQLMPGKLLMGNLASWGNNGNSLATISGQLNGGVIEGIVGKSWSTESWGGWKKALDQYRQVMAAVATPKLVIFHQMGDPADYQSIRYGLVTCMLDDGYFSFSPANSNGDDYHRIVWVDEFDAKLGQAITPPPTSPWQNGVWRRDFQNGIAIVNPKGNGTQTVNLGGSFRTINGSQVPSINNGQIVNSVTLQDRDAIILLSTTSSPAAPSQAKPTAPTSVSVQ